MRSSISGKITGMQRRRFLAMSLGGFVAGALGATVCGQQTLASPADALNGRALRPQTALPPAASADDDAAAARRYDKERRFALTGFGSIAYIDRGGDVRTDGGGERPVALFLHGFPLSGFQWRGVIDRLCAERRCLAPDLMGLGYTQVTSGQSVTPAAQAAMIAAFLDHLAVPQVDLIANDSGGAVAQLFVTRNPQRVRTLLLTNCDVETDSPPPGLLPIIELARTGLYPDLYLEPWLKHKDVARSPTGLGGLCYVDPAHPTDAALEQYLGPLVSSEARKALVNRYTLGLTPNPLRGIEPLLRKCTVPSRIVWGTADNIFSPHSPDYLASVLPQVTGVRRIPDGKLFFPEEYPHIIAEEARLLWQAARRS